MFECRPELRNHGVGWVRAVERLRNGGVPPDPVFLIPETEKKENKEKTQERDGRRGKQTVKL